MLSNGNGVATLEGGARLGYFVDGPTASGAKEAPPLLLHRPLGGSMVLWGEFARRLAVDHRVIAFDPRGVAASSDVPWLHSTRDMARDAVGLLDFLGVERADVFGLSLGGMVASWMAIDASQRVARLVLASTLPRASAVSSHALSRGTALLRSLGKRGVEAEVFLVTRILSSQFRDAHPERVKEIERAVRANPTKRRNLFALAFAAARHNVEPELRRVTNETLLLFGELDPIARRAAGSELFRDLTHSRLEVLTGAGHDLSLEQPILAAERVSRFLRNVASP